MPSNGQPDFSQYGFPVWFHHNGQKMQVVEEHSNMVRIGSSAAELKIFRFSDKWRLKWEVYHCHPGNVTSGEIFVSRLLLQDMFGLRAVPNIGRHSMWLIDRFGGDWAEQFVGIRFQKFLNIPCPGTGNDGDPNISIVIDSEISTALRDMLA